MKVWMLYIVTAVWIAVIAGLAIGAHYMAHFLADPMAIIGPALLAALPVPLP